MLLHLLPNDISKYWGGISEAISKSLPPFTINDKERMLVILKSLMSGIMQCWLLHEIEDDKITLYAIMTTEFSIDPASQTKNLLIFSLYGLQPAPSGLWEDGYKTLRLYAKVNRCQSIIAFTDVPEVLSIISKLGGDINTRLITLEV